MFPHLPPDLFSPRFLQVLGTGFPWVVGVLALAAGVCCVTAYPT